MRAELVALIHDYQLQVAQACWLLHDRLGLRSFDWFSWRRRGLPQSGWLDDHQIISYYFHGIGCRVTFGTIVVDFDFGPDGRCDGFDAWRLAQFAKSVPFHRKLRDLNQLREELQTLLEAGELVRDGESLGSHLLYFPPHGVRRES